jgi:hypothetical protein
VYDISVIWEKGKERKKKILGKGERKKEEDFSTVYMKDWICIEG